MALHLSKRKPLHPVQNEVLYLCFKGSKQSFGSKKFFKETNLSTLIWHL